MSSPPPPNAKGLPSLTAVTLRRGITMGRIYLGIGTVVSLLLAFALLRSGNPTVFVTTYPLELPLFAGLGATGGLMVFVSDRTKGVLEYLIAYGVRPRALYVNYLLAAVGMSSIVLAAAFAVGLGGFLATGHAISWDLEEALLGYTVPMTYASALFACSGGMFWSAISTPRTGMNSPVGIAPMLGVAPPVLVLVVAESFPRSQYYDVTVGASVGFLLVTLALLAASARLMSRERYLSAM